MTLAFWVTFLGNFKHFSSGFRVDFKAFSREFSFCKKNEKKNVEEKNHESVILRVTEAKVMMWTILLFL